MRRLQARRSSASYFIGTTSRPSGETRGARLCTRRASLLTVRSFRVYRRLGGGCGGGDGRGHVRPLDRPSVRGVCLPGHGPGGLLGCAKHDDARFRKIILRGDLRGDRVVSVGQSQPARGDRAGVDGVHDVGGVHDADGGRRSGASVVGRRERDAVDTQRQRLRLGKRRGRDSRGASRARRRGTAASHGDSAEHQLLLASFRGGEAFLEGDALVFGDAAVVNLVVGARHHRAADKPVRFVLNVKDSLGPALGRHELLSPELGARDHGLDVLGELLALHDDRRAFVRERGALLAESEVEASEVIGGGLLGLDPGGDDPRVQHRRGALVLGDADGALVEEGRLGRDDVELHVASVRR